MLYQEHIIILLVIHTQLLYHRSDARPKVCHFLITAHQCEIARDDYLQAFQAELKLYQWKYEYS